jgi:hypothetical protein
MRTTLRRLDLLLCAIITLAATAAESRAGFISGGGGLEGLGTFTGHVDYVAADSGHATLTINLLNTSPTANGGFLTAFVFHNPSGLITGASVTSTNTHFGLLGGPSFHGGIAAPPFGNFDIGASVTDQFLGGGSPVGGIGVGESSIFTFALTGSGLNGLTLESFFGEAPTSQDGHPGPVPFLARFRGFNNGGSDKVPGVLEDAGPPAGSGLPSAPEPATLVLAGIATVSGLGCGWRRRGRALR